MKAKVFNNEIFAGVIENVGDSYFFTYDDDYINDPGQSAISLSLPKTQKKFISKVLFPFFFGLLAEGINKEIQCKLLKIDENDHFSQLLKTAHTETIGAVTIKEITQ